MPSFDIVSETNEHELANAIDQANREISSRFDLKGTNSKVELAKNIITLTAPTDFQVKQLNDILQTKFAKRHLDIRSLKYNDMTTNLSEAKQTIEVRQGLDQENAKKITKLIKASGIKVQAAIQGEEIRVTGKKRDDLQEVIGMLKEAKVELPLDFKNFRE